MKLSEVESQFKDFVQQTESDERLSVDEVQAKNKVWAQVKGASSINKSVVVNRWLIAASIIMLLLTGFAFIKVTAKKNVIAQLHSELEIQQQRNEELTEKYSDIEESFIALQNQPPIVDTVYKTKVVYKQVTALPAEEIEEEMLGDFSDNIKNEQLIQLGDEGMLNLASIQEDVESFKIEYGQRTKEGNVPWKFTVKYQ